MSRIIPCPIPGLDGLDPDGQPLHFIAIADEFTGHHAVRHNAALQKGLEAGARGVQLDFMISAALLDDWNLPGMNGNIEAWDFSKIKLGVIAWINHAVLSEYNACFDAKKKYSAGRQNGHGATTATK
jgi:hypothetical protein